MSGRTVIIQASPSYRWPLAEFKNSHIPEASRGCGCHISSLKNSASRTALLKWKKNAKATGYEIQYSTSSKFKSAKTVSITKNSTVSKKLTKLTRKKTYYVRIRCYKKAGSTNYYSAWSAASKVKIAK